MLYSVSFDPFKLKDYWSISICTARYKEFRSSSCHAPNNLLYIRPCPATKSLRHIPRLIFRDDKFLAYLKLLARFPACRIPSILVHQILVKHLLNNFDTLPERKISLHYAFPKLSLHPR